MPPAWVETWGIPTPFPVGDVNCHFLDGKEPALVDPGPRTPEAWAALSKRLEGKRIRRLVFTHYHVDHAGLARRLQAEHGVEVAAHSVDGGVMAHWGDQADARVRDYAAGLTRAGVPPEQRERMRYGGIKVESLADPVKPDTLLEEGDHVRLGDQTFEVLHTPGHTAGSMLLRSAKRDGTFSGDTLLPHITPNALSVRASERGALPDYLATLRRLQHEELGTVLPGHGRAFRDASKVIRNALHHADVRQERIVRLLRERPGTAYEVARRLFLRLPDEQLFLAVSETLGHLEHLRLRGRVLVDTAAEADHYSASSP